MILEEYKDFQTELDHLMLQNYFPKFFQSHNRNVTIFHPNYDYFQIRERYDRQNLSAILVAWDVQYFYRKIVIEIEGKKIYIIFRKRLFFTRYL